MAKVQLGKSLPDQDVSDIAAFLQSLTGKLPDTFTNFPILPTAGFEQVKNGSTAPPQK
jgi:cytochrome c peroxidase